MTRTQVTLEGMRAAQSDFQNAIQNVTQEANKVDGINLSLNSSWRGSAASTYQAGLNEWLTNFLKARSALNAMFEKLQQTTGDYTSTHSDTSDQASKSHAELSAAPGLPL
jgi:WXG100 family type VII secretion target